MAHILVVEDDGETAALICAALEAEQHDVVHLADGLQALGRLGRNGSMRRRSIGCCPGSTG